MYENNFPNKRYRHTLAFLKKHIDPSETILDLGVENPFSEIMKSNGYQVSNTKGEDLDIDFKKAANSDADVVTAFEIFEHLVAPFNILKEIKANKLVASIPMRLWFSPAYRSKTEVDVKGDVDFEGLPLPSAGGSASFDMPESYEIGLTYQYSDYLRLFVEADLQQWSQFSDYTVDLGTGPVACDRSSRRLCCCDWQ